MVCLGRKSRLAKIVHEKNSRAALRELEDFLRPELIGRFDNVITFKPLSRSVRTKDF